METACDSRSNNTYQKLLDCINVEGVREHQAAFQAIADNSDDPVYPGTRAAGTDGYADSVDYVAGLLRRCRLRRDVGSGRDHVQLPGRVAAAHPDRGRLRDRCVHRQWLGDRGRSGDPGRHQPDAATGVHERLRGRRLRWDRLEWRQRHRAGSARHVLLRNEGVLRRAGRRRGGHHLQPRQHTRPRGSDRRRRDERRPADPWGAGPGHAHHPGGGSKLRRRRRAGPARLDGVRRGAARRDPHRLQRHRRVARQERRTTS